MASYPDLKCVVDEMKRTLEEVPITRRKSLTEEEMEEEFHKMQRVVERLRRITGKVGQS